MDRHRMFRYGRIILYPLFGLWVFATVFYLTLPYNRFKDWVGARLASEGYELEATSAGPSLGLGMTLDDVILISRGTPGEKPIRIVIDKASISVSPWAYLFGTKSYSIDAEVFGGELGATYEARDQDRAYSIQGTQIDLAEIPWVKAAINMPLGGRFRLDMELRTPKKRISEAKGRLSFACTACVFGDGKEKLIVKGSPLLAEGLGLPKIRLGDFTGKIVIEKGMGRIVGMQIKSPDLDFIVEGEITLADPVANSRLDLYIRFKPSDTLLSASEKLRMIIDITAQMGKRPDGFYGFRISGPFRKLGAPQWLMASPFATSIPLEKEPSPSQPSVLPPPLPLLPPSPPPPPAESPITLPPSTVPSPPIELPPPSEPPPPAPEESAPAASEPPPPPPGEEDDPPHPTPHTTATPTPATPIPSETPARD